MSPQPRPRGSPPAAVGGKGASVGLHGRGALTCLASLQVLAKPCELLSSSLPPLPPSPCSPFRLVANLLFRMGASAALLSNNRASWGERAKYRLQHIERVHVGQNDEAYK